MRSLTSLRGLTLAVAGTSIAAALACPAIASAAGPADQVMPASVGVAADGAGWRKDYWDHRDWNRPEWGPGWNNGYPAPGWVPPAGWIPPPDWLPPAGWAPPPGWGPPPGWVGPCAGPLFDLLHPVRCG